MYVKPAAGLSVRDPIKKDLLPEEGREVPDSGMYWQRRVRDGDVVISQPPANAVRKATPPAPPAPPADAP